MEYAISSSSGDSIRIAAPNWMVGLGKAVEFLGIDLDAVELRCTPLGDHRVEIVEIGRSRSWLVERRQQVLQVRAVGSGSAHEVTLEIDETVDDGEPPTLEVPSALMSPDLPAKQRLDESVLAERLFGLSTHIASSTRDDACQLALDLVLEWVPVEAGSVVRGLLNDSALTFMAVAGPVAHKLRGRRLSFGRGLLGQCFDLRASLVVQDVQRDDRHLSAFDRSTGFETRAALCVPVLDHMNQTWGVIQLLNPVEGSFLERDVEIVETVARTLAAVLGR